MTRPPAIEEHDHIVKRGPIRCAVQGTLYVDRMLPRTFSMAGTPRSAYWIPGYRSKRTFLGGGGGGGGGTIRTSATGPHLLGDMFQIISWKEILVVPQRDSVVGSKQYGRCSVRRVALV